MGCNDFENRSENESMLFVSDEVYMKKLLFISTGIILALMSCTRNLIQPQYVSILGRVHIQGQSEVAGVYVSLYPAAETDSTFLEFVNRYPSLPLTQNQSNIFDHRRAEPLFTTEADAEGNYEFIDVPQDQYNLVIEKRGYGWRYICNVDGEEKPADVTLVREIRKAGELNSYTEWPAFQHIVITGNITVPGNSALLVDKGAVVRFDGNYRINGEGQINCFGSPGDPVWFTSNTVGEFETQTYWAGFNLSEAGTFKDVRMDHAKIAVSLRSTNLIVERGAFSQITDTAIFASREANVDISESCFYDSNVGIVLETQSSGTVHHNIFSGISKSGESSAIAVNASTIAATDNFIYSCSRGISMLYGASGEASNNDVLNCKVGLYGFSFDRDISVVVRDNTFDSCSDYFVEIHHAFTPKINSNNFIGAVGRGYVYAFSKSLYYYEDLDARQNYWYGLSATEASRLITDEREIKDGGGDVTWSILVDPVAGAMIENAHPR